VVAIWAILRGLDERERLLSALMRANEELDAFAHSAAHDLRAPLRAIDGYASVLQSDHSAALSPEARRLVGRVRERASSMARLIEDLLAFSRVGRQAPVRSAVDMNALA